MFFGGRTEEEVVSSVLGGGHGDNLHAYIYHSSHRLHQAGSCLHGQVVFM